MLLCEPIVSMGDWTHPRPGLTRHERGIPLSLLEGACLAAGFGTSHKSLSLFPALPKLAAKLGIATYNSRLLTRQDSHDLSADVIQHSLPSHKHAEQNGPFLRILGA